MAIDLRKQILDLEQALRGPLQAWAWILGTLLIGGCLVIVMLEPLVWTWLFRLAQVVLIGASTAAITRFLGSMGMFRDAIADVLGEDRWLDRRKDLEDLWRRITRRVFLPGFREDAPDADRLLASLNSTMTQVIHRPGEHVGYYVKNVSRRVIIDWHDQSQRVVTIRDRIECEVVPFDQHTDCIYDVKFTPTTGETLNSYTISLEHFVINDAPVAAPPEIGPDSVRYVAVLRGRPIHSLSRTMVYTQQIDADPIFFFIAGRVIWGMNVIVDVNAAGLRVNFEEIGLPGQFRLVHEDPANGTMERDARNVLLPDHGFVVIMTANPPPLAENQPAS